MGEKILILLSLLLIFGGMIGISGCGESCEEYLKARQPIDNPKTFADCGTPLKDCSGADTYANQLKLNKYNDSIYNCRERFESPSLSPTPEPDENYGLICVDDWETFHDCDGNWFKLVYYHCCRDGDCFKSGYHVEPMPKGYPSPSPSPSLAGEDMDVNLHYAVPQIEAIAKVEPELECDFIGVGYGSSLRFAVYGYKVVDPNHEGCSFFADPVCLRRCITPKEPEPECEEKDKSACRECQWKCYLKNEGYLEAENECQLHECLGLCFVLPDCNFGEPKTIHIPIDWSKGETK